MAVTKIKLNSQAVVADNVSWADKKITDLAAPVDAHDAVNKEYLDTIVSTIETGLANGVIGPAEDASYADGLFTDFTPTTPTGTAVDRFNEVLKSLSPSPSPSFSSISVTAGSGVSGKLSFGASNVISGFTNVPGLDINGAYSVGGNRLGIINASTALSGTLANNVTPGFVNGRPYPNLSFGDADQGWLHLEVNGTIVRTVDLATFASGASLTNGSGFTLSAATPVAFTNGDPFNVFKYRTGTWTVAAAALRNGYNTICVKHEYAVGLYRTSQVFDLVVDSSVTATTFSSETLNTLAMTGSRKISGVEYHTAGTAKYGITIANAYRDTYSASGTAVGYNGTNATITKDPLGNMVTEADSVVMANKTATVAATRLLNGSISVNTTLDRTVQADATSPGASIAGLLIDNTAESSTNTLLTFNGEARRIDAGLDLSITNYGSGGAGSQPAPWQSAQSLIGGLASHNTGLMVYNGQLIYPKLNASVIANGPAGNVNYAAAAGLRTFLGYFYDSAAHSNFRFNVTASGTTFVSVATGPSGQNLTFEVLAPNTTKNGSNAIAWKDAAVAHSGVDSDVGCYASTYGNVIPTNWGCTIGTKNTSTSGNVIVVKITAAAAWTGNISSIGITWL